MSVISISSGRHYHTDRSSGRRQVTGHWPSIPRSRIGRIAGKCTIRSSPQAGISITRSLPLVIFINIITINIINIDWLSTGIKIAKDKKIVKDQSIQRMNIPSISHQQAIWPSSNIIVIATTDTGRNIPSISHHHRLASPYK